MLPFLAVCVACWRRYLGVEFWFHSFFPSVLGEVVLVKPSAPPNPLPAGGGGPPPPTTQAGAAARVVGLGTAGVTTSWRVGRTATTQEQGTVVQLCIGAPGVPPPGVPTAAAATGVTPALPEVLALKASLPDPCLRLVSKTDSGNHDTAFVVSGACARSRVAMRG